MTHPGNGPASRPPPPSPKWHRVAGSEAAAREWRAHPVAGSPLRTLFAAESADEIAAEVRGWYSLRQLSLLQLSYLTVKG